MLITVPQASAQDPFTNTFSFESSQALYTWKATAWTECDGACVVGTQTRDVVCVDQNGGNVAASNCSHISTPRTFRECPLPPCIWVTGAYGACMNNDTAQVNECNPNR